MNQVCPLVRAKMNRETYDSSFPLGSAERQKFQQKLWGMYRRCYDPQTIGFKNWGGRGIGIEKPWYDKETETLHPKEFMLWAMSHGWKSGERLHIDRINNDGNYSPDNCRFVTCKENSRNKRNNRIVTVDGISRCLVEWAEILGISVSVLNDRWNLGWSDEDIIRKPIQEHEMIITHNGISLSLNGWARKLGIRRESLRDRFRNGWTIEDALTKENAHGHVRIIEHNGVRKSIKEWAAYADIPYRTFLNRLNRGWKFDDILKTEVIKPRTVCVDGVALTVRQAAEKGGISNCSVRSRLSRGWSEEDATRKKVREVKKIIDYNGKRWTLMELASQYGISYKTLAGRLWRGWDIEKALNQKIQVRK